MKAQYAIMRFAKYKGPEIGRIEAHNERTKEEYASNPDVDTSRSKLNYHLVTPTRKYRAESETQIAAAQCRVRKDSIRVVEALFTASPEFFEGKSEQEIRVFFDECLEFMKLHQSPETFISAVVHLDEKTPHMHFSFVPLTDDGRLSAKEVIGNRKKLTWWQDEFWKHMVKKYPDLERGESASETGRTHIPPRLFKEAVRLNKEREALLGLMAKVTPQNAAKAMPKLKIRMEKYIVGVELMDTKLKKYDGAYKKLKKENEALTKEVTSEASMAKRVEEARMQSELNELRRTVSRIPPEMLAFYKKSKGKEQNAIE